jgi:hypothetical protein
MGWATLTRWGMALAAAVLLCGCGRDSDAPVEHSRHATPKVRALSDLDDADLVSAVSTAGSVDPVNLRFKVPDPPRVGQPLHLELVLSQQQGLDITHMLVSLQAGDGLDIESDHSIEFDSPAAGATQHMVVDLRARQQGLLSLTATVLVDAGNSSLTRNFSIPLIATP